MARRCSGRPSPARARSWWRSRRPSSCRGCCSRRCRCWCPKTCCSPAADPRHPYRLELDQQLDRILEAELQAPQHAPLAALDRGLEVAAADLALDQRVDVAVELARLQRHRMGLALQRELAVHLADLVAVEDELVRLEGAGGKVRHVEEVLALDLPVEEIDAGVDRGDVDHDLDLACAPGAVEEQRTVLGAEAAAVGGGAVVAVLVVDEGVGRIDGKVGRVGLRLRWQQHARQPRAQGDGRQRPHSGASPVKASLNFTCTSFATTVVSVHSPCPMVKSSRLTVKLPVAVEVPPDCVMVTGTIRSRTMLLMVSLPLTTNLPLPRLLMAVDRNVASGNFATSNQVDLGSSTSASGTPSNALSMLICTLALPLSGFFGSSSRLASKVRNLPSTGTPICLVTKVTSLCAGCSRGGVCAVLAAAAAASSDAQKIRW